jgi:hypothetical protein
MTGPPTAVAVTPGPLAGPVLGRVVAAIAAAAGLGIDRVCEARLVGEALAAQGSAQAAGSRLEVRVEQDSGSVTLRAGPLVPGGADALLRRGPLPGVGPVLERLADDVGVDAEDGSAEYLVVRLGGAP